MVEIFKNPNRIAELTEEEQTPELCRAAVASSCYAIRHVKRQTENLVRMAVFKDPYCLVYVHDPPREIEWAVLEFDPYNIRYIRAPVPNMIKLCLQRVGPDVLRHLSADTPQLRETVRTYNPKFEVFVRATPLKIVKRGGNNE